MFSMVNGRDERMSRPRLLDLFCGAGGAAMGYYRVGFDVVGVDVAPQPRYPFTFYQQGALHVLKCADLDDFDAVHASPPCQPYSVTRTLHSADYPMLVDEMRLLLQETAKPFVIENVVGAPLTNCVTLCGSSFGLGVRRHRRFETNWTVWNPPRCAHHLQPEPLDVTGTGGPGGRHRKPRNMQEASVAMGIDWMTRAELSQAIPPAYTEFIGGQLVQALEAAS